MMPPFLKFLLFGLLFSNFCFCPVGSAGSSASSANLAIAVGSSMNQADEAWQVASFERFVEENSDFYAPLLASVVRVLRVRADCGLNVRQAVRTLRRLVVALYAPSQTGSRALPIVSAPSCDVFFAALKRKLVQDVCTTHWQPNFESTTCYSPNRGSPLSRLPLSPSVSPSWSPSGATSPWSSFGPAGKHESPSAFSQFSENSLRNFQL